MYIKNFYIILSFKYRALLGGQSRLRGNRRWIWRLMSLYVEFRWAFQNCCGLILSYRHKDFLVILISLYLRTNWYFNFAFQAKFQSSLHLNFAVRVTFSFSFCLFFLLEYRGLQLKLICFDFSILRLNSKCFLRRCYFALFWTQPVDIFNRGSKWW